MPKKDTASAILGMLSNTGAHTRPPAEPEKKTYEPAAAHRDGGDLTQAVPPVDDPVGHPAEEAVTDAANAASAAPHPQPEMPADPEAEPDQTPDANPQPKNVRILPVAGGVQKAPLTVRLTPEAAQALREAWLDAKRDDVLLSATDFASALVLSSLKSRKRAASRAVNRG